MGAHNTTCFASQQTIALYDKCRVVAIRQAATYTAVRGMHNSEPFTQYGVCSSTCGPDSFWEPVGDFIEAEYEDSGRVILGCNPSNLVNVLFFLQAMLQGAAEVFEDDEDAVPFSFSKFVESTAPDVFAIVSGTQSGILNAGLHSTCIDVLWPQVVACWDRVWEIAEEHRQFYAPPNMLLRPLQFAIIHEAAYNALAPIGLNIQPSEMRAKQRALFDRALATSAEWAARLADNNNVLYKILFVDRVPREFDSLSPSGNLRYGGNDYVVTSVIDAYLAGEHTKDECFESLQPWMAGRHCLRALDNLNLRLSPMVFTTQDYTNQIGQKYSAFVQDVSKTVTAQRARAGRD